jgi:hypothetical protein
VRFAARFSCELEQSVRDAAADEKVRLWNACCCVLVALKEKKVAGSYSIQSVGSYGIQSVGSYGIQSVGS